ncbi:MAG: hypothetical protein AAFX07_08150 [Pseudomonadota bacterium]
MSDLKQIPKAKYASFTLSARDDDLRAVREDLWATRDAINEILEEIKTEVERRKDSELGEKVPFTVTGYLDQAQNDDGTSQEYHCVVTDFAIDT